ncbi:eIF2 kinase Gcn2p negative regulator [Lambiella insularis]|nr:eIF2 kinase Gcn2p negative regulator [Lambiella insularis]
MSELECEILAIKAIYGDGTLITTDQTDVFVLSLPSHSVALRLRFPLAYPAARPDVVGTESSGPTAPIGYGCHVLEIARDVLDHVWNEGEVCLYDLIQELESLLDIEASKYDAEHETSEPKESHPEDNEIIDPNAVPDLSHELSPKWIISTPTTEKKSLFVARACSVSSPSEASSYVSYLLASDKKVAKATHNITAFRIRSSSNGSDDKEIVYQDCDDDGETAAGGRLLHLLQVMNVWNVLVVVSRWYGGVKLGPDRFRIISTVAREVLVDGSFELVSKTIKTSKKRSNLGS